MADDCQADVHRDPDDKKEDGLKGVEAYETPLVKRLEHKKQNCRNDGQVGQSAGHVIGEPGGCGWGYAHALCAASTLRTGRSIRDLGSTGWAKSHRASFKMTGKVTEHWSRRNGCAGLRKKEHRSAAAYFPKWQASLFSGPLDNLIIPSLVIVSRYL